MSRRLWFSASCKSDWGCLSTLIAFDLQLYLPGDLTAKLYGSLGLRDLLAAVNRLPEF